MPFLVLHGHTDEVTRVRYTRGGSRLLTVSTDGTQRVWDPEPEPRMHVIGRAPVPKPEPSVAEAAGRRATVQGKVVIVRDLRSGAEIPLRGHTKTVTSVHFDHSGERLVTTSEDGDAIIWDARSGAQPELLRGNSGALNDAGFSPDGRWVVTAGPVSARLWRSDDTATNTFIRNTNRPLRARFADNRRIVTVARDGKVREWFCDICGTLDELVALAKRRLDQTGRTLTPEESRKFAVD
jgi:WD40 repeat protein